MRRTEHGHLHGFSRSSLGSATSDLSPRGRKMEAEPLVSFFIDSFGIWRETGTRPGEVGAGEFIKIGPLMTWSDEIISSCSLVQSFDFHPEREHPDGGAVAAQKGGQGLLRRQHRCPAHIPSSTHHLAQGSQYRLQLPAQLPGPHITGPGPERPSGAPGGHLLHH